MQSNLFLVLHLALTGCLLLLRLSVFGWMLILLGFLPLGAGGLHLLAGIFLWRRWRKIKPSLLQFSLYTLAAIFLLLFTLVQGDLLDTPESQKLVIENFVTLAAPQRNFFWDNMMILMAALGIPALTADGVLIYLLRDKPKAAKT